MFWGNPNIFFVGVTDTMLWLAFFKKKILFAMKIFSITIIQINRTPSQIISGEYELVSFGYFQRSSIQEFMNFFSKTLADQTPQPGQRQSVENQDYTGHVFTRQTDLSAVVICDKEYPVRVAFAVLSKVLDDFLSKYPRADTWTHGMSVTGLRETLGKYQNPAEADNILRIQKELDETKIIMHKTIESVLQRGQHLEDLVAKSDELSQASKVFYTTAKKTNSCCKIM